MSYSNVSAIAMFMHIQTNTHMPDLNAHIPVQIAKNFHGICCEQPHSSSIEMHVCEYGMLFPMAVTYFVVVPRKMKQTSDAKLRSSIRM